MSRNGIKHRNIREFLLAKEVNNPDYLNFSLIYRKGNLQLLTGTRSLFILIEHFHDTYINIVATDQQIVINNALHDVSRLLLSEIQTSISKPWVKK